MRTTTSLSQRLKKASPTAVATNIKRYAVPQRMVYLEKAIAGPVNAQAAKVLSKFTKELDAMHSVSGKKGNFITNAVKAYRSAK